MSAEKGDHECREGCPRVQRRVTIVRNLLQCHCDKTCQDCSGALRIKVLRGFVSTEGI